MENDSKKIKSAHKILIVDDVARNIQILGNILSSNGYQIAYAQNGKEALRITKNQNFDLILLDIMMPEMNGYEVCTKLQEDKATAQIPIIFLTAKADMESIIKGFKTGGQDYITKPFNSAELLARVNTHILLREQKDKLKHVNIMLEQKVEERTAQLKKANKLLKKLDHTKNDFLSIISHELRSPLNGIIGLTDLLDQSPMDISQQEYVNHLKEVSERLVRFSDMALLITSLRIDKYQPDFLSVSVNHIVESGILEFNKLHGSKKLNIKFSQNETRPLIFADSDLIRQCCILILENSLKFAGKDRPVDIKVFTSESRVIIEIKDYGPGFSENALEHLFELFGAGDILHLEGIGLSLAAVKLIMNMHSGKVEVSNGDGSGAIVKLHFDLFKD